MATKKSSAAAPKKQEAVTKEKEHKHLELEKEVSSLKSELQALKKIVESQSAAMQAHELSSKEEHAKIEKLISSAGGGSQDVVGVIKRLVLDHHNYAAMRYYFKKLK